MQLSHQIKFLPDYISSRAQLSSVFLRRQQSLGKIYLPCALNLAHVIHANTGEGVGYAFTLSAKPLGIGRVAHVQHEFAL